MKIEALARPGLVVLGVVGVAATALLGFAAGVAVARDPEAVRRTTRRVARAAALGLERVTLLTALAREHVGDLWAEAREAAVADVDAADFKRAATAAKAPRAAPGATATDGVAAAQAKKPPRQRTSQPKKKSTPAAADEASMER